MTQYSLSRTTIHFIIKEPDYLEDLIAHFEKILACPSSTEWMILFPHQLFPLNLITTQKRNVTQI